MITRASIAAGQFYPRTKEDLENTINKFRRRANVEEKELVGCVSPHAGYIYSGVVQAGVYESIGNENPVFAILGPNHRGIGPSASIMTSGNWETPLGECRIHNRLARSILENSNLLEDDLNAHTQEHSIEVQLPWLQNKFQTVDFVPICLNANMMDISGFEEIGNSINKAVNLIERDVVVIASSDFTHYGGSYGYTPVTGSPEEILDFIEKVDKEAANRIVNLDPEGFLDVIEEYNATICGYGPITSMLYTVKNNSKKGQILDYSTSYEVSGDPYAIVGYCGIIIEKKIS